MASRVIDVESKDDPVACQLHAAGIKTNVSWLFDQPVLGISNGTQLLVRESEIIYRMVDSDTVLIVLYRRSRNDRLSLSFSFSGLMWFIRFLTLHVPSVKTVRGLVDVYPYQCENGISSDRLLEFYQRCGAQEVVIDGVHWVQLDIDRFAPIR